MVLSSLSVCVHTAVAVVEILLLSGEFVLFFPPSVSMLSSLSRVSSPFFFLAPFSSGFPLSSSTSSSVLFLSCALVCFAAESAGLRGDGGFGVQRLALPLLSC